jgi:hypothetical protein
MLLTATDLIESGERTLERLQHHLEGQRVGRMRSKMKKKMMTMSE